MTSELDKIYSFDSKGIPIIDAKTVSEWIAHGYGESDREYYEAYSKEMLASKKLRKKPKSLS